ncbi:phage holin family protein [Opitutus sp. ER46]|uniref:phage holin family protein n=1 Tax=Opitutus sp. ER46 TaxID=2161864 RepID=UPI000D3053E0|nr:phage holin family protein [Opitutus sp. ER46]PTX99121.1 phage holin family protein [Opitutus sp. ER46]
MRSPFTQLLLRWLVLALGVLLATRLIPGIHCDDGVTLFVVVVLLSFFNAILRPLLVLFTLPFIIVTMGLGVVVINALLFLLVGRLVDGFQVAGFWSAVGGSLVVSVTNWFASGVIRGAAKDRQPPPPPKPPKGGDVIDI